MLIKFYGDNCSYCVKLDKTTLKDSAIINLISKDFDCYKVNTWKKENSEIRLKHRIWTEPVIIFKNANGEEIDRIVGYVDSEKLLQELNNVTSGKDTYLSIKKQYESDSINQELLLKYAEKETNIGRAGDEASQKLWYRLIGLTSKGCYEHYYARFRYYTGVLWKDENPDSLISVLAAPNTYDFKIDGFKSIIDFFNYKKETVNTKFYSKQYSDYLFENREVYKSDKMNSFLDTYSWLMTECNENLDNALIKIDYVLLNISADFDSTKRAGLLDTKSQVLWSLNRNEEALQIVDECIELLPDNEYLKEKKDKIEQEI